MLKTAPFKRDLRPCSLTLGIGFWKVFSGYQMHDRGFTEGEAECAECYVAMEEASLVN